MKNDAKSIGFGHQPLGKLATDHAKSKGRLFDESESPTRTCFQRDRDRILHSTAFRRLNHKTQVFFANEGDHYRTRLTHTIEVAQIARSLARALMIDDDLAEAIALVHDFGHTPFGHTGEDALNDVLKDRGGFDHNIQALRVVTKLERRYAEFVGLNLTWETLEGLVKHNGPISDESLQKTTFASLRNYDLLHCLDLAKYAGLEAQVAAIADDIAYNTHDIDDGLRSGLLTHEMLFEVPFLRAIIEEVDGLYGGLDDARRTHEITRRVMTAMVEDVISHTLQMLSETGANTADDVRNADRTIVCFSPKMRDYEKSLKSFLFANLYRHPTVMSLREKADQIVRDLFYRYVETPSEMGTEWSSDLHLLEESAQVTRIVDYLAGMTDSYALIQHRRLFDHTPDLR